MIHRLIIVVPLVMVILLVAGFFIYAGGLLFYRLLAFPRKKIRGVLLYRKTEPDGDGRSLPQELKLYKIGREHVTVSFNMDNKMADFYIQGNSYSYDIIIKNSGDSTQPHFVQGWGVFLRRKRPTATVVQCTMPGVLESEGSVFTTGKLFHTHKFETGGFTFQYQNPTGKWFQDSEAGGVNILKGRI